MTTDNNGELSESKRQLELQDRYISNYKCPSQAYS